MRAWNAQPHDWTRDKGTRRLARVMFSEPEPEPQTDPKKAEPSQERKEMKGGGEGLEKTSSRIIDGTPAGKHSG